MEINYYLNIGALTPSALALAAIAYPKIGSLIINKKLTSQEQRKFDEIKSIVSKVAIDLGISRSDRFSFQVSKRIGANAFCMGTTSSIGGPLIVLGDAYFKNFNEFSAENLSAFVDKFEKITDENKPDFKEWIQLFDSLPNVPEKLKEYLNKCPKDKSKRFFELSKKFSPFHSQEALFSKYEVLSIYKQRLALNDYTEWLQLLDNIPDTPEELGKYLDECSEEKRNRIMELSVCFNTFLSRNELKAIIAHELGHAKHHHILKIFGMFLIAYKSFVLMQSLIEYSASNGPSSLYEPLRLFSSATPFAALPLAYIALKAISRNHEIEADGECSGEYQKGLSKLHKKNLINKLLKVPTASFAARAKQMLKEKEWMASHPNSAKRLAHAVEIDSTKLQKTTLNVTAKALIVLGLSGIAEVCISECLNIFSWSARHPM